MRWSDADQIVGSDFFGSLMVLPAHLKLKLNISFEFLRFWELYSFEKFPTPQEWILSIEIGDRLVSFLYIPLFDEV